MGFFLYGALYPNRRRTGMAHSFAAEFCPLMLAANPERREFRKQ